MSFHHAIIDGWGHAAMLGQLTDFFSLATKGRPISVEAAANVHKEYIALEGQLLDSQEAASFWQRQLAGFEPAVPPRPADGVPGFGSAWRSLDETTLRAVYDRHTSNRVSLKAVLLDAYLELMAEWLGRDDVAVGVVANGRTPALSDPLGAVGLFWNMVPFRRPSAGPTDSSLVSVHRALVALEPHAAYPLSEIRVRTRLEELFFCSFNFVHFHNTPDPGSHHGTVLLETRAFDRLHYPLNFALEVVPRDGAIQLSIEYDRSRIEDEVVSSLADRYLTILLGQDSEATMTLEAQ